MAFEAQAVSNALTRARFQAQAMVKATSNVHDHARAFAHSGRS
jgi:hypothetical protein